MVGHTPDRGPVPARLVAATARATRAPALALTHPGAHTAAVIVTALCHPGAVISVTG